MYCRHCLHCSTDSWWAKFSLLLKVCLSLYYCQRLNFVLDCECCCCEQPIRAQIFFLTAISLDAHNNNIHNLAQNSASDYCMYSNGAARLELGTVTVWYHTLPSRALKPNCWAKNQYDLCTGWPICPVTRLCWHQFCLIPRLSWDGTDVNIT